jgi:hypothetical protein
MGNHERDHPVHSRLATDVFRKVPIALALFHTRNLDPGAWPMLAVNPSQLISGKQSWDRGRHNAFTDLIRFRGEWFCTFREADDHVGGDGKLRVLRSRDGGRVPPVTVDLGNSDVIDTLDVDSLLPVLTRPIACFAPCFAWFRIQSALQIEIIALRR